MSRSICLNSILTGSVIFHWAIIHLTISPAYGIRNIFHWAIIHLTISPACAIRNYSTTYFKVSSLLRSTSYFLMDFKSIFLSLKPKPKQEKKKTLSVAFTLNVLPCKGEFLKIFSFLQIRARRLGLSLGLPMASFCSTYLHANGVRLRSHFKV